MAEKKAVLSTTINADIMEAFKEKCKEDGVPMNVIIELFIKQYNSGKFEIILGRTEKQRRNNRLFFLWNFVYYTMTENLETWKSV